MCIRQQMQRVSATRPARSGSERKAVTSLTYVAPAPIAAIATATFDVSIDRVAVAPESPPKTGITRASSSSAHGRALVAEGAAILDIGGESTRPGAAPVGDRAGGIEPFSA